MSATAAPDRSSSASPSGPFQRWYDQIIKAAGVDKKGGPHTARHTFATMLRAKGFSLEEIQGILGHSSRVITEIYAKLTFTPETRDRYLQLFEGGAYKAA